jgi:MerR family transcriptional regulator/heat shock protein HspR
MSTPDQRPRRSRSTAARGPAPTPPSAETPVYVISVAAELTGLHPQTLRTYDRLGLVSPGRAGGGGRRYSWRDIELLREIAELSAAGIGLEGVRRILELENHVTALQLRLREVEVQLAAAEYALATRLADLGSRPNLPAVPRGGDQSLVLWTRRR